MVAEIERSTNRATHNDKLAIKRKGKPEEVAYLIAFLLSDESQYVTGSIYSIDGGWNI
jgi:NAD(P)-dependent dehydrogenase (short-subunit alcohol dehydrogenase family)